MDPEAPLEDLSLVRERIAERLASVERLVAVMSGKGGVGKTVIATNLALALALRGERCALLDADLHSPTVAKMLGLRGQPVRLVGETLRPAPGPAGLRVQSMDFFLQGTQPLKWEGAAQSEGLPLRSLLEDAALSDLLGRTDWGDAAMLVIDLPPGADRLPALARLAPAGLRALAVTIPTELSLLAVERSVRRAFDARVPLLGVVENMGSMACPRCGEVTALFRDAPVEERARELGIDCIGRVPFDPELAAAADAGRPFLGEGAGSPAALALVGLADRVREAHPVGAEEVGV